MASQHLYSKVKSLVQAESLEQAITLAGERDTKSVVDAQIHLRWADLLEKMGLVDGAVVELNLAIRDDPHEESAYRRLAEIHLDQGNPEKAARCRQALMSRRTPAASDYRELGRIWEEARQKSVFECEVDDRQYLRMRERVEKEIDPEEDSIRYYFLCSRCVGNIRLCGLGVVKEQEEVVIV